MNGNLPENDPRQGQVQLRAACNSTFGQHTSALYEATFEHRSSPRRFTHRFIAENYSHAYEIARQYYIDNNRIPDNCTISIKEKAYFWDEFIEPKTISLWQRFKSWFRRS
jgi:hypothetical protein